MPTENRRVAAYLPKAIDDQLEAFKTERGLKGDSPALIAILEEYFGVSREVNRLVSSEYADLSRQLEELGSKFSRLESELFSELKSSLLTELRSELLDKLRGELPAAQPPLPPPPGQLTFLESESDTLSESSSESLISSMDINIPGEDSEAKSLDGSVAWSGVELSARLKRGPSTLSAIKEPEELARWTQEKDPDRIAWMRVGRGQYFPITDAHQGF